VYESTVAIVAGADTTSTALANAVFYLLTHPVCFTRLREELDGAEDKTPYLDAVLSETLRLQPALPNGVQRTPPLSGGPVVVAGQFVFLRFGKVDNTNYYPASSPLTLQFRFRHGAVRPGNFSF
jgi:cytochrome P450